MAYQRLQLSLREVLELAGAQHGVVARAQLLELGLTPQTIKRRVRAGRLHPIFRGVYAVGRPEISQHGRWMAAVLRCGPDAVLSHRSAATLWEIAPSQAGPIELSVPSGTSRSCPGVKVHRRTTIAGDDLATHHRIPVTAPICTLVDIAPVLPRDRLETAINETDKHGLVDPETLRSAIERMSHRPGVAALRELLDRRTFALSDSELERRFLPLARQAGLPLPLTGRRVNGFKVDFHWPEIGLVVETDGLRYHRTQSQQARDRLRDQAHAAAGLTPLRFTHAQVRFEPEHVRATLVAVARRLKSK
jgi:hypothetical protein